MPGAANATTSSSFFSLTELRCPPAAALADCSFQTKDVGCSAGDSVALTCLGAPQAAFKSSSATACMPCAAGEQCSGGTSPPRLTQPSPPSSCPQGYVVDHDYRGATAFAGNLTSLRQAASSGGCAAVAKGAVATISGGWFQATGSTQWHSVPKGGVAPAAGVWCNVAVGCKQCGAGEYCQGGNHPPVRCAPGQWDNDRSAATACVKCEAGTHCPGGAAALQTCPVGTWDADLNPATVCELCTAPGTFCAGGADGPLTCPEGTWDHDSRQEALILTMTHAAPEPGAAAPTNITLQLVRRGEAGGANAATVVAHASVPLSTRHEPTELQVSRALAALIPHSQRRAIVKKVELSSQKNGAGATVRTWEIWFAGSALRKGKATVALTSPDGTVVDKDFSDGSSFAQDRRTVWSHLGGGECMAAGDPSRAVRSVNVSMSGPPACCDTAANGTASCCRCVTEYLHKNRAGCGPWDGIDSSAFKSNVCDKSSHCHATVQKAISSCTTDSFKDEKSKLTKIIAGCATAAAAQKKPGREGTLCRGLGHTHCRAHTALCARCTALPPA